MTRSAEQKIAPYLRKIADASDLEDAKTEARLALRIIEQNEPKPARKGR